MDVNQAKVGDQTSPLLMATINGHFDLAKVLLDRGADPNLRGDQRRHAALRRAQPANGRRAPAGRSLRAHRDQTLSYLDMMTALLDKGADPERAADDEGVVRAAACRASTRSARRRSGAPPTPATSTR